MAKQKLLGLVIFLWPMSLFGQSSLDRITQICDYDKIIHTKFYKNYLFVFQSTDVKEIYQIGRYDLTDSTKNIFYSLAGIHRINDLLHSSSFCVYQDSLLAFLTYERDEILVLNPTALIPDAYHVKELFAGHFQLPDFFTHVEGTEKDLFIVYQAQGMADTKSLEDYTFFLAKLHTGAKPSMEEVYKTYNDTCLFYHMNGTQKSYALNEKYLFLSIPCLGTIRQIPLIKNGKENIKEIRIFEDKQYKKLLAKKTNLLAKKYRLHPTYELLNKLDQYYFHYPNIFNLFADQSGGLYVVFLDKHIDDKAKNMRDRVGRLSSEIEYIQYNQDTERLKSIGFIEKNVRSNDRPWENGKLHVHADMGHYYTSIPCKTINPRFGCVLEIKSSNLIIKDPDSTACPSCGTTTGFFGR